MRDGLQLAYITLLWLAGICIDWDCLVPQCIMGSHDQWGFPLFFSPQWVTVLCTALMAGNPNLSLCKGNVKESTVTSLPFWPDTSSTSRNCASMEPDTRIQSHSNSKAFFPTKFNRWHDNCAIVACLSICNNLMFYNMNNNFTTLSELRPKVIPEMDPLSSTAFWGLLSWQWWFIIPALDTWQHIQVKFCSIFKHLYSRE